MNPITWRSVASPNFSAINSILDSAQRSKSEAFDTLGKRFAGETQTNVANWDNTKNNNTQEFLNQLNQYRTPEELQAAQASGALDALRQRFGAQIDQAAIRTAEDGRLSTLQQRALTSIDFKNKSLENELRPQIQQATALAAAGDKKGLEALFANSPTLRDFMGGKLTADAIAGERAADQHTWLGHQDTRAQATLDETIRSHRENEKVARINAATGQLQAQNSALNYAAQLSQNVTQQQGNVVTGVNKQLAELDEKKGKLDKSSVYSGDHYEDKHAPDLVKVGKDMGISTDAVGSFVKRVKEDYPNGIIQLPNGAKVPITKGLLESAIVQGADTWSFGIDSFKGNRLYNTLVDIINHKDFGVGYQNFVNEQNLIEAQKQAIKEQGQTQVNNFRDSAQPYVDAFTSRLQGSKKK